MKTCLQHHKICNAECCRVFYLRLMDIKLKELKQPVLTLKRRLTEDKRFYYRLHGCIINRNKLIIKTKDFKTEILKKENGRTLVAFYRDCNFLKNNLCLGHPDRKPEVCKILNWETAKKAKGFGIKLTPNCMYKGEMKDETK